MCVPVNLGELREAALVVWDDQSSSPAPITSFLSSSHDPSGETPRLPAFLPLCLFEPVSISSCPRDQRGTGAVWVMFCGCEHV